MSNPKDSKYGIQSLDFLGDKFKIGYSTLTGKFQTKLGGYLTILMGLLSTSMFFIVMSQFFSKEAPVVMTSSESGSRRTFFDLHKENLYLPLAFLVGPRDIPASQISRYVTLKAIVDEVAFKTNTGGNAFTITPFRSFDYKPCSEIKDPHMQAYLESFVSLPGFGDLISCPDFKGQEKDFIVTSDYITYVSKWTYIKVYPCSLPDRSQCASINEIRAMKVEYGYPSKLLKPSDYKNPVESQPIRYGISIDPRSRKAVKEIVTPQKVFDDTMSLIPAKLRVEYSTLHQESIDLSFRDETRLHCSKAEIDKGVLGRCPEYLTFDYFSSPEIVTTTRSYKKLTTMLGEFGGILKIITTAAFFFYGLYSMRKVKSLLGGIIFGDGEGSEKQLRDLVQKNNLGSKSITKVEKIRDKGVIKATKARELKFEKLVERFVSRRSNVDNLMQKLNLLELIEKVVFKEHEKTLVPLVLLKAEQSELQKHHRLKEQESITRSGKIFEKIEKGRSIPQSTKKTIHSIINQQEASNSTEVGKFSYQKAFDSLLNSNPDSPFCRMIKDYMVSQLEDTFPESGDQGIQIRGEQIKQSNQEVPKTSFLDKETNKYQKIELIQQKSEKNIVEKIQSSSTFMTRKRLSSKGFMRPTNSPVRLRARTLRKGSTNIPRRSLLSMKEEKIQQEKPAPKP